MKKLGWLVIALAWIGLAQISSSADEKKKEAPKFDTSKLLGDWTIVSGKKFGAKLEGEAIKGTVTFHKDKITIDTEHEMTYKIDASKDPVEIDMKGTKGPADTFEAKGILAFDGENLKLTYGIAGRPKEFDSKPKSMDLSFVLKKAEKKK